MTTPAERHRAQLMALDLLEAIAYRGTFEGGDVVKPVGAVVRELARRVLRHYPTRPEIERGVAEVDP